MKILDCREHKCPQPVVETRKLILAETGKPLQVLVGDEMARENVARLARSQGYEVKIATQDGGFSLDLTPETPAEKQTATAAEGKTVVFISGEVMGSGDDELGRILLKNFLFTLNDTDAPPDTLLFVNAGVKLTCTGSEVIEALEKLACNGTDIASCGLCLEFYGLKEKLAVGRATNMHEIITAQQEACRIIRP